MVILNQGISNVRSNMNTGRVHAMDTKEIKKILHELIERMDDKQLSRLYQLVRGIFGKAV